MSKILTIAIDGPAGAGKSTIAKKLAGHFEIVYVDTGAMYRAVAYYMVLNHIDFGNEIEILKALDQVNITIVYENHTQFLYLNTQDVTELIRDQAIGEGASKVSAYLPVRQKLVAMQQEMAKATSLVMDGRDIGTHVLTKASVKIYLTAEVMVRATRRYNELVQKGLTADIDAIAKEIADRDYRDMNRDYAPLVQAEDAILVDTSKMSIDEVVQTIIQIVETR
jgi:cytidylate kinase